jgi:hypothetical protein
MPLNTKGSNLLEGDDDPSSSQKRRISFELLSSKVADFATLKRMGSDDMNGDSCIISLSRFRSGKYFVIEFSKQEIVTKAVFQSFLSRLP